MFEPACVNPGQRTMKGTRVPPSSSSPCHFARESVSDITGFLDSLAYIASNAAIVAGEDQDRIFGEVEFIQGLHDSANALVDTGNHRGVGWVVMASNPFLRFELLDQVWLRLVRAVNSEVRQVKKKGFRLVSLYKVNSLVGQEVH